MFYIISIKTTAHKGLTNSELAMPPFHWAKYNGGFCYVRLPTKIREKTDV